MRSHGRGLGAVNTLLGIDYRIVCPTNRYAPRPDLASNTSLVIVRNQDLQSVTAYVTSTLS